MPSGILHEQIEDLSIQTRDMHRAISSLAEELYAIDIYRQRWDACRDIRLKAIFLHNMREEMEHSIMLIEWIRRHDKDFDSTLRSGLFIGSLVTEDGRPNRSFVPRKLSSTIGSLKE